MDKLLPTRLPGAPTLTLAVLDTLVTGVPGSLVGESFIRFGQKDMPVHFQDHLAGRSLTDQVVVA
ncbi:hypothetical protein [Nonomuraea sp. SYSU D8015]|uniref:hypothetical protein n=1 Tax=Nonomuraea sp. SYSU D8015 TaxID=2593644 RepID=UPI0016614860|nr:hypothetical protein [Nonomuraea sp. SYSU D8015]